MLFSVSSPGPSHSAATHSPAPTVRVHVTQHLQGLAVRQENGVPAIESMTLGQQLVAAPWTWTGRDGRGPRVNSGWILEVDLGMVNLGCGPWEWTLDTRDSGPGFYQAWTPRETRKTSELGG